MGSVRKEPDRPWRGDPFHGERAAVSLIAVAAPVVVWSAWPFHAAAWRNARHGASSMDTLVSLGITAACGWSVYAMFVLDRGQGGMSFR